MTDHDIGEILAVEAQDVEEGRDLDPEYVPNRKHEDAPAAIDWEYVAETRLRLIRTMRNDAEAMTSIIAKLRREIWTLNGVIVRRKWAAKRLRAFVDAVKYLHRPVDGTDLEDTTCRCDGQPWPCKTDRALEAAAFEALPEEARRVILGYLTGADDE